MSLFPAKRILVAVDLAAPSRPALDAAMTLALRWNAVLEVVNVQHPPVISAWVGLEGLPVGVPHASLQTRREIERRLRKAAGGFPPEKLKLLSVHGWPPSALQELARPQKADLLVMGTNGYEGLDRLLTGSVAEAVIRGARIPVLTVPERKAGPLVARVLAPWNGRPYATRALRWARNLARSLGMTLVVLYVDEAVRPLRKDWPGMRKRLQAMLGDEGWELRVGIGDARARIVSEANSGRYEFAVLSAHRRGFASDFVLGSTVERLLRHSSVPVVAVPSGGPRLRPGKSLGARAGARLY